MTSSPTRSMMFDAKTLQISHCHGSGCTEQEAYAWLPRLLIVAAGNLVDLSDFCLYECWVYHGHGISAISVLFGLPAE